MAAAGCVFRLWLIIFHVLRVQSRLDGSYANEETSFSAELIRTNSLRMELHRERPEGGGICRNFPGLNRKQRDLCYRHPDLMTSAIAGLQLAVTECQFQFRKHRWNCSALRTKNRHPHSSRFLRKGYRETAFAYAISSAGVTHAVAKYCGSNRAQSCRCRGHRDHAGLTRDSWRWSGCSHQLQFAFQFARFFLDSKMEKSSRDLHSRVHLHNSQFGRQVVVSNTEMRCKCHGLSGSCQMKTCWPTVADFRRVGHVLKNGFDQAQLVEPTQAGNRVNPRRRSGRRSGRFGTSRLLFYERSPNYCDAQLQLGLPGVSGRSCNKTSADLDNCQSLCCGRGYNILRQKSVERCNCRFHWCCSVRCDNCTVQRWVTVCK